SGTIRVDTRVVAATNQWLEDEIEAGRFRDDLYYRLNVVPVRLTPLRERREDVRDLAVYFLKRYSEENRRDPPELTHEGLEALEGYDWPGNVGELENSMERAVVMSAGHGLKPEMLSLPSQGGRRLRPSGTRSGDLQGMIQNLVRAGIQSSSPDDGKLYERLVAGVERELIEQVMQLCDHIQVKAASRL